MSLRVEVVYALPDAQHSAHVEVPDGATVRDAFEASQLSAQLPHVAFEVLSVGVWGHVATWSTALRANDRVELYRKLVADPKEARRQRAMRRKPKP